MSDSFLKQLLLYVKKEPDPLFFWLRVVFLLFITAWGLRFIFTPLETNYAGKSFLHLVNLPFHEASHLIFRPFGRFMTSLGGSLGQLLMPLICTGVLLIKTRDTYGAAITWWWFGENFIDIAPYINDARALVMPLLGGNTGRSAPYGFHDWHYILNESGLLKYDHVIAGISHYTGAAIMISAFIWGGLVLYEERKLMT